jgi:hypothetical protein
MRAWKGPLDDRGTRNAVEVKLGPKARGVRLVEVAPPVPEHGEALEPGGRAHEEDLESLGE